MYNANVIPTTAVMASNKGKGIHVSFMLCKNTQLLINMFFVFQKEIITISSDSSIEPSYGHVQPLAWEDYFPKD